MTLQELDTARDTLITPVDPQSPPSVQIDVLQKQLSELSAQAVLLKAHPDSSEVRDELAKLTELTASVNSQITALQAAEAVVQTPQAINDAYAAAREAEAAAAADAKRAKRH